MGSCTDTIGKTLVERLDDMAAGWLCAGLPDAELPAEAAREIERLEHYSGHCEEVIAAHNAVGARQEAAIQRMRAAGAMLANVAYNLAQKPGHALTSDDVALLDKLRREWDAALRA